MTFTYTYRSSDGARHAAEIEAESRDDAFARVRAELGIKPIKVVAAGCRGDVNGRDARSPSVRTDAAQVGHRAVPYVLSVAFVLLAAGAAWWWMRRDGGIAPYRFTVNTPQGPVTYTVAAPLPRQAIPGDRARIETARGTAFRSPAETWLARFAEPGRKVGDVGSALSPAEADFPAALREPVRIASTDFTEAVDLKRIVAGMKREMRAYLAGGGTVDGYLAELKRRQRLEISYRERAEQKLNALLNGQPSPPRQYGAINSNNPTIKQSNNDNLRAAYSYWLKANASLKSMGIHELPLPDALRAYQMGMGIDE